MELTISKNLKQNGSKNIWQLVKTLGYAVSLAGRKTYGTYIVLGDVIDSEKGVAFV